MIEVQLRNFPGGTGKNNDNFSQDSRYSGRDLDQSNSEYASRTLPLSQQVLWQKEKIIYFTYADAIHANRNMKLANEVMNCQVRLPAFSVNNVSSEE
jgi:hypothetical protein